MSYQGRVLSIGILMWLIAGISCQEEIFCTKPADLAVILDSSDASLNNWSEVLEFAKALVDFFSVSPDESHMAIITYSSTAEVAMDFNTLQGDRHTPDNVQDVIDGLEFKGGYNFIDKALLLANERLFTPEGGMRDNEEDVLKILVLLTAGMQTKDAGLFTPLSQASQPLRDKGVEIYALGVGTEQDLDVNELIQVTGKVENVLTTDNFDEITTLAEDVSKVACGEES